MVRIKAPETFKCMAVKVFNTIPMPRAEDYKKIINGDSLINSTAIEYCLYNIWYAYIFQLPINRYLLGQWFPALFQVIIVLKPPSNSDKKKHFHIRCIIIICINFVTNKWLVIKRFQGICKRKKARCCPVRSKKFSFWRCELYFL